MVTSSKHQKWEMTLVLTQSNLVTARYFFLMVVQQAKQLNKTLDISIFGQHIVVLILR